MDRKEAWRIRSAALSVVMLAAGAAFFVLSSRTNPAPSSAADTAPAAVRVTILHVNDTHGQLEGLTVKGRRVGGAARLATAVKKVRQAHPGERVLLVDCGDDFSRGDQLTQRSGGAANITVMNRLGFDVWVLGNGEFYSGLSVLRQRMAEANFPALAANVTAGGQPIAQPYVIEQVGPVRIALLGLSIVRDEGQGYFGIDEADPIATARALVAQLHQQADVVVAMTHLGLPDDVRLAAAVEGIDLILGGHTHTVLQHGFRAKGAGGREVLICQAGDQYRYLGEVDLELSAGPSGAGLQVTKVTAKLIPLDETVKPDPATEALLAKLKQTFLLPPPPPPTTQPATTAPAMTWPTANPFALVPLHR